MSAAKALRRLEQAGFSIQADHGKLRIHPADRLTPEQRAWIGDHKAELLAALTASNDPADDPNDPNDPVPPRTENFAGYPDIDPHENFVKVIIPAYHLTAEPPHHLYERPQGERVRCADCRHAAPADDPAAWRRCRAGQRGDFGYALIFCEHWEATV